MKKFLMSQIQGWRWQEALWLLFCLLSIISLSLWWGDPPVSIVAAATGMLYTVFAGKGKPICFLFGFINTPLYAVLAFNAQYYGDFALNVYYFAMMFPGLAVWLKNRSSDNEEGIKRTRLSPKGRMLLLLSCAAGIALLWSVLLHIGGSRPLCDAATNILSIAAMILTVRRAIEEWVLWIAVNAIEVVMWYKAYSQGTGHLSILLMWLLFLANGIYLFSLWRRIENRSGRLRPGELS